MARRRRGLSKQELLAMFVIGVVLFMLLATPDMFIISDASGESIDWFPFVFFLIPIACAAGSD